MTRKCNFNVLHCNISLFKRSVINMGIRLYKMPDKIKWKGFWDFKHIKVVFTDSYFFIH